VINFAAFVRFFFVFGHVRKVGVESARCIVLAVLVGVVCPVSHAQNAHFSGSQLTLPVTGLNNPRQVAVDAAGNLYIADSGNNRVLKETLSGGTYTQSTIGSGLNVPFGVAVDANGNVYIADLNNGRVLKETLSGGSYTQSTISSNIPFPTAVAVDGGGNVYVAGSSSNQVFKETLSAGTYAQSTIGSGLNDPLGVAVDSSGNVYIADSNNGQVLKEVFSGGTYTQSTISSGLSDPASVAVDRNGNVYVGVYGTPGDAEASQVLMETLSGGGYTQSLVGSSAYYDVAPIYIAVDGSGNILMATLFGISKVTPSAGDFGTVNVGSSNSAVSLIFTFDTAGTIGKPAVVTQGVTGLDFTDTGTGLCTRLGTGFAYTAGVSCTVDVTFNPKSNGARYGAAILLSTSGNVIATGYVHGTGSGPQVNFLPGTQNTLSFSNVVSPYAIAEDAAGSLYIAEAVSAHSPQNAVVKETWTGSGYTQTTVATGLAYPVGVAVDGAGNVYIADQDASEVLKETPLSGGGYTQSAAFTGLGTVEAVAVDGSGNVYISSLAYGLLKESLTTGVYSQNTVAGTIYASGIAVDQQGNIYLGDNVNNQVLKETLSNGSYTQSTIATGLSGPHGVAVDGSGNVYIADTFGSRLVKETLSAGVYTQSTLASGMNDPLGVVADGSGNVFASSAAGNSVWKLDFADPPSLNFATTTSGSTSNAQTVTVENIGNTPLSFPVLASGNNPSISTNFTLNSTGTTACPLVGASSSTAGTLAAGASCQLLVSFAPVIGGSINGSLVLTDTNLNALAPGYTTQSIALSGTALDLPTLSFSAIASQTYGNAPFTVSATSASSGAVTYAVASGPATISGSTVTLTGVGTVVLNASQAASGGYAPATTTTSFTVAPFVPTLSFSAIASQTYGNPPFTVSATSASSGTVTYAVASGPATISGSTVTLTGVGTVVLNASQAASGGYAPATATISFTIAAQTFTLTPGSSPGSSSATTTPGGAASYALMLAPSSGTTFPNPVTFSVTGLPTGATATFSPATLQAGSGATSVTLAVQTSNSQTAHGEKSPLTRPFAPTALGLLLLPLVGMRKRLRQIPRLSAMLAFTALSFGAAMSLSGCSSNGSSSQSAKSYTMVVTAKDATTGTQTSTNLTLTVQ
jgi:DNA-binding beta-propeller fold protein YncE